jgi:hypothetical protein
LRITFQVDIVPCVLRDSDDMRVKTITT